MDFETRMKGRLAELEKAREEQVHSLIAQNAAIHELRLALGLVNPDGSPVHAEAKQPAGLNVGGADGAANGQVQPQQ